MSEVAVKKKEKLTLQNEKKNKVGIFDIIGGIFKPILTIIIGAGVLQALRDVLVQSGAISTVSSTYIILNSLGNAVFYFLPIFLAISSAQVFGASQFMAAGIAAFFLYPGIVNLFDWSQSVGWNLTFFGVIPISYAKYPSSVLPMILIVYFQSKIEPLIKKIIPDLLKTILVPVLTMFVTCVFGLVVLGPIGTWIGDGLAFVINWLNGAVPWLVPTIVGAASPFLVLTGSHYSLFPVATQNLAQLGFDTVLMPGMMVSNFALAGTSFAVMMRSKQKKYKSYCASSGLTSLFGISQSSLYGIAMPLKKPLIASIVGGGLGGFYAGITMIKCYSFVTPGLLSFVGYAKDTANLINAIIASVIALVGTFVITLVLGFKEPDSTTVNELVGGDDTEEKATEAIEVAETAEKISRLVELDTIEKRNEANRAEVMRGATKLSKVSGLSSTDVGTLDMDAVESDEADADSSEDVTDDETPKSTEQEEQK